MSDSSLNIPITPDPYPDIAKWWSAVDSTFKLTPKEVDDMVIALDKIQQKEKESCVDYLLRFQSKVTELRMAGKHLADEEQGRKCLIICYSCLFG